MWSSFCQKISICSTYFELVSSKYTFILLHYHFANLIDLFQEATPITFLFITLFGSIAADILSIKFGINYRLGKISSTQI